MSEDNQNSDADISDLSKDGNLLAVFNLSIVSFLVVLGLSITAPILPNYAESFQVSYTLVGLVISSFAITRMFLDMPAGLLSRKFNKKMIMIGGLVLIAISSILAGIAPNYITLVIARMIEGAGSALYVTTANVFLAQLSGKEKRGRWMSFYWGMLLLGSVFGPTVGGFLADTFDIRAPFFSYALIAGASIIPTLTLPNLANSGRDPSPQSFENIVRDIRQVLSSSSFVLVSFAIFTLFFLRTGVRSTLVPLFATNNLGLESSDVGVVLSIASMTMGLTIVPVGSISDRVGRKLPLALCILFTAGITLFIPFSTDLITLSVALAIYGITTGLSGPTIAYVTDVSPEDKLEVSMGLYRMINDVGYVMGPLLLGFIADLTATPVEGASHSGLIGPFPFVAASVVLIIAFIVLLKADDPSRDNRYSSRLIQNSERE